MAKFANPGEMRTKLKFVAVDSVTDEDGDPVTVERNVFGEDVWTYGKLQNTMSGNEAIKEEWVNNELLARNPVTVTVRYSPLLLDESLLVYKWGDDKPYEIISAENVNEQNEWIEIKARRRVAGR